MPRRAQISLGRGEMIVEEAADVGGGIKGTKTGLARIVSLDEGTVDMLRRHYRQMDQRARLCGVEVVADAYVFSLEPDCSKPMPADYLTKRLAVLKEHLGIADKRPETIALEDEALKLYRQPPEPRPPGRRGPTPKDAFETFDGSILGLRKFTSSELLDAGFNIAAVAQRQGHGTQVLAKHYARGRRSADRKAAEHLGRLIHRDQAGPTEDSGPSL